MDGSSAPTPRPGAAWIARWRVPLRVAAVLAALALVWTVSVGWWLPGWLLPRLQDRASQALGAPVQIMGLALSPWSLRARLDGLVIGPAGAPWLRVERIELDGSMESAWRLAPVLEQIRVQSPEVFIERIAAERLNISPAIERLRAGASSEPSEPVRFSLNNIRIEGGMVRYADRVLGSEHRIDALVLGIPFLSNLPTHVSIDVEPTLTARVDGSPFSLTGRSRPFDAGMGSDVSIRWQDVDLARWAAALAPLLPEQARVQVVQGRLAVDLGLAFERPAEAGSARLQVTGRIGVTGLKAHWPARGLRADWDALDVQGIDVQVLKRDVAVEAIRLDGLGLSVEQPTGPGRSPDTAPSGDRSPAGHAAQPGLPQGAPPVLPGASVASAPGARSAAGWSWRVGQVDVTAGPVALPVLPTAPSLSGWQLQLAGLSSASDAPAARLRLAITAPAPEQAQAAAASPRSRAAPPGTASGTLSAEGELHVARQALNARVQVRQWPLARWLQPWQARLPVRVLDGVLDAQAEVDASPLSLTAREGQLDLARLSLVPAAVPDGAASQAADRLSLAQMRVRGLRAGLDLGSGRALPTEIASIELDRLDTRAQRLPDGRWSWNAQVGADPSGGSAVDVPTPGAGGPTRPAALRVASISCTNCQARVLDRSVEPPVELALQRADLQLRGLSSDPAERVAFELSSALSGGGRLALSGRARAAPLELSTQVRASDIDLRPVQPYIDPHVNLVLAAGKARLQGTLGVTQADDGALRVGYQGSAGLNELRTLDKLTEADFARWKSLTVDALNVDWRPDQLEADLGSIALDDFYGRVIVNADGNLNLRDILRRSPAEAPRSLTEPSAAASGNASPRAAETGGAQSAAPTPGARLRWSRVALSGGRIDFTDNFIRPNYSARLTALEGTVSPVAWNDPKPADVRLTGRVDGNAPLTIEGQVHPLGARLFTDIKGEARGIELTRLSPYAARYAGYAIDKGTLSVAVQYKVDNGRLDARNQIFLDQLTFGERVDSPDAIKAPVLLAVALLKNGRGEIDVNLPISGSLDDPQFSVAGIVVRLIVNLIVKAVTSPFALLASAVGSADAELGHVAFAPGSNDLDEPTRQKLDALIRALAERPSLRLEATGRADPERDAEGLRQAHLRRLLRAAKARETGQSPVNLVIEPQERERWLEAAYKASNLPDRPRNALGLLKSVPVAEMEARLLASVPVGPEQFTTLANQRADRVKAYLVNKLAPERVLLTASRVEAAATDAKVPSTGVEFAIR